MLRAAFHRTVWFFGGFACLAPTLLFAQNDSEPQATTPEAEAKAAVTLADSEASTAKPYAQVVLQAQPVGYWRLDDAEGSLIVNQVKGPGAAALDGKVVGQVKVGEPGPRPGRFPTLEKDNKGMTWTGKKGFIRIADPGDKSPLDFDLGDAITIEAWVECDAIADGQQVYIIGKGRTKNPGVAAENQNFAMRLRGLKDGSAGVSFLFRNANNRPNNSDDFHRWTSTTGFEVESGWHHVAISYVFGRPETMTGYIDGKKVDGVWDMGGPTKAAPVVDNDEVWIGSSLGGSESNTLRGSIDEIALYRRLLTLDEIQSHVAIDPTVPTPQASAQATFPDRALLPPGQVLVEIMEGVPDKASWGFTRPEPNDRYTENLFAFLNIPHKYNLRGVRDDRTNPFVFRASGLVTIPAGKHRILVRSRSGSRLYVDGKLLTETRFARSDTGGHGEVTHVDQSYGKNLPPLMPGDNEKVADFASDGGTYQFTLESFVGGGNRRPEPGETVVAIATGDEPFRILSADRVVAFEPEPWIAFMDEQRIAAEFRNTERRRLAAAHDAKYWEQRHATARQAVEKLPPVAIPELPAGLPGYNAIDRFISAKLAEEKVAPRPLVDDWTFLRRIALDTIGMSPTPEMVREYFADPAETRRAKLIDRLLAHPGWADHWVGYWQDVLAENPNILNPTLNNTGPFRFWLHESFTDNKPVDRFVTELVMMEGSTYFGGPGGFAMSTENDVPMAAKAHIVGVAFMGLEMKCARCHDAPYHDFKQEDLFSMAAMLKREPQAVPATSSVPATIAGGRKPAVEVTLKPGVKVEPEWHFEELVPVEFAPGVLRQEGDTREKLAALITSPRNPRFAQVMVNRLWQRYLGLGIVEPVDDWEHFKPSHPELLDYLAREFVVQGYDLKHVARLIFNSHTYQRATRRDVDAPEGDEPEYFAGPTRRRLTAEQLLDSLFLVADKRLSDEELNLDVDGTRRFNLSLNLGTPRRAWQLTSLSNERDRPSLALPMTQSLVDVMETFGWRGSRQSPVTIREESVTVAQPAIVSNGNATRKVAKLSVDSRFTKLAVRDQPVEKLVDAVVELILTRPATKREREVFVAVLSEGYADRLNKVSPEELKPPKRYRQGVSWSNHLSEEANRLKIELEKAVREGDPPTPQLKADWRERMEDVVWALVNSPEFAFVP